MLFFYSLDPKLQLEHLRAATPSRSKFYETNIKLLCDNRPAPVNILNQHVPTGPLQEGAKCPLCGFLSTPSVMAHPTARAILERASAGTCLQCFAKQEQLEKFSVRNAVIQHLLTHQVDCPTTAVIGKQTHVFDMPRLFCQHLGPSANRLAKRFAQKFSLLVMTIRPSTCHEDSTPNVTAGYLKSSTALLRHRNIFDIGILGSAHDGLLLILPSHDCVFLEKARFFSLMRGTLLVPRRATSQVDPLLIAAARRREAHGNDGDAAIPRPPGGR